MANGYPDNQACWACSATLGPVDGAITVFAYAAWAKRTPCQESTVAPFDAFLKRAYGVASGTRIDPVYVFGYIQYAGDFPGSPAPLQQYLNAIGVRDPVNQSLHNATPGPQMYRPGPGNGYVGNGPGDPGLGKNPYWSPPGPLPAPPPGGPPGATSGNGTAGASGGTDAGSGVPTTVAGAEAWVERNWLPVGGAVLVLLLFRGGRR